MARGRSLQGIVACAIRRRLCFLAFDVLFRQHSRRSLVRSSCSSSQVFLVSLSSMRSRSAMSKSHRSGCTGFGFPLNSLCSPPCRPPIAVMAPTMIPIGIMASQGAMSPSFRPFLWFSRPQGSSFARLGHAKQGKGELKRTCTSLPHVVACFSGRETDSPLVARTHPLQYRFPLVFL